MNASEAIEGHWVSSLSSSSGFFTLNYNLPTNYKLHQTESKSQKRCLSSGTKASQRSLSNKSFVRRGS